MITYFGYFFYYCWNCVINQFFGGPKQTSQTHQNLPSHTDIPSQVVFRFQQFSRTISVVNLYLLFLISTLTTLIGLSYVFYKLWKVTNNSFEGVKRVLLVIAHPDDECMFFGPVILHLTKTTKLYLICLSSGDYHHKGNLRKTELWESCRVLGISPNNIQLYRHDLLPDDPFKEWNPELVADIILQSIETLAIDTVISFDGVGVSGHLNHISIYKALKLLKQNGQFPEYCKCYVLNSVNVLRKFLGFFNILYDSMFSSNILICSYAEHKLIRKAMRKHLSQYLWFRKLFIIFSRYSYINSFSCMTR